MTALLAPETAMPSGRGSRRVVRMVGRPARDTPSLLERVPPRWRTTLALLALMVVSAALSGMLLVRQSLRLDEAQSLWQTSHGFRRMYQLVAQDVHVPLYHTVLRSWVLLVGNGVVATRLLSLVLFLLTIPAVYALGRRVLSERASLYAAGLVAVSPFMTWYGNEVRMYSMLTLIAVLNQLFFLRLLQRAPGANWTLYAVTALAGIYTHYFFWFTLLTQGLFFLVNRRRFPRGTFVRLLAVAAGLVVALLPWLLFVRGQGGSEGNRPLLAAPTSVDLFNTFSQFLFGFQDDRINTLLVALWPLAVLLALLAVQKTKRVPLEVGYLLLMGLFPVLAAFAVSVTARPLYVNRYLIVSLPSLLLFLTWLFTVYGRRTARLLRVGMLVALLVASVHQATAATTPTKEDYRAASDYLRTAATPQDVVVISPPFTSYPFQYYWKGAAALTTLPAWNRFEAGAAPAFDPETLPAQAAALKVSHRDAWLVLSYDQGYEKTIVRYFDTHFERKQVRALSPGLMVIEYRMRYDQPDTTALLKSLNKKTG
jgi:mannosyltransferase